MLLFDGVEIAFEEVVVGDNGIVARRSRDVFVGGGIGLERIELIFALVLESGVIAKHGVETIENLLLFGGLDLFNDNSF